MQNEAIEVGKGVLKTRNDLKLAQKIMLKEVNDFLKKLDNVQAVTKLLSSHQQGVAASELKNEMLESMPPELLLPFSSPQPKSGVFVIELKTGSATLGGIVIQGEKVDFCHEPTCLVNCD